MTVEKFRNKGSRRVMDLPEWPPAEIELVNTVTAVELLQDIDKRAGSHESFAVATLNLDHIVKLRALADFRSAYLCHTHVVADGNPVVWLRRISRAPVDLVTGADLIEPLMEIAAQRGFPVAFLGSTEETLQTAAEILEHRYPGLEIVVRIAPGFGLDPKGAEADAALREVAQSGAKLCLLSLGAPKQELLAARGIETVQGCGFISVGAGLEFIAGHQRRAPRWMRHLAMEWLWRFLSDPRRLAWRYVACFRILPGLIWQALQRRTRRKG